MRPGVHEDAELAAVWQAATKTPYPMGPYFRLLLLTGARKTEASGATWSEFDLDAGTWTVPEERFKGGVHASHPALERTPWSSSKACRGWVSSSSPLTVRSRSTGSPRARLGSTSIVDQKLGRECDWQIHDLRRTVRTRLAGLGISDTVAEKIIGHGRKGRRASTISTAISPRCAMRSSAGLGG